MTCPSDGSNLADAVKGFVRSLQNHPTMGGFIGKGLTANMDGTPFRPGMGDFASAVGINGIPHAAVGQAFMNAGQKVAGTAIAQYPQAADIQSAYENARQSAQQYRDMVDRNPNGGPGPCDDPDDPDDPNLNPNDPDRPPLPGDPRYPGSTPPWWAPNPGRPVGGPPGSRPPIPVDPIVIDLDGNGVELTSATESEAFFDFEGDGYRERTGWVRGSDGLLVFDRNGNDLIDNGSELFGGQNVDGFDALGLLDTNGDGRIDAADAEFASLKVWRDLNGDGLTDAGELFTLHDVGITSFDLNTVAVGQTRAGNYVARSGAVNFGDGHSTTAESVYFSVNAQQTVYVPPEDFEYVEAALWLPNLRGYGTVKDLAVATSLDSALRADLEALVRSSDHLSAGALHSQFTNLVQQWVNPVGYAQGSRGNNVNYDKLATLEAFWGEPFWEQVVTSSGAQIIDRLYDDLIDGMFSRFVAQASTSYFALEMIAGNEPNLFEHSLSAFAVFGYDHETDTLDGRLDLFLGLATVLLDGSESEQHAALERLLDFSPYLSKALFDGQADYFQRYLAGMINDETNASSLSAGDIYSLITRDAIFGDQGDNVISAATSNKGNALFGYEGHDILQGRSGADILVGGTGNDMLSGNGGGDIYVYDLGDGNDIVNEFSGSGSWGGDDALHLGGGILPGEVTVTQANNGRDLVLTFVDGGSITIRDTMVSSDYRVEQVSFADGTIWNHAALVNRSMAANGGNDVLYGSYDGETIVGGIGNDTIFGRGGNDIIIGGTGNDTLSGDGGNDTYIYDLGDGNDIVNEFSSNGGWGGNDSIQFGTGILASEVTVTQANNGRDLVLTFVDGGSVTIKDTMVSSDYRVETVAFADGTIWNHAALVDRSMAANGGNDVLYGSYDSETIVGGIGNDTIFGRGGNDIIIGGTGNDTLSGDGGNDTYIYDLGDGNDIVNEFSGNGGWGGNDSIQFGAGILASEVSVVQANNGRDLVLTFVDGSSITIKDTMVSSDHRVEQVSFADGSVWTHAELLQRSIGATPGDDIIYGSNSSETLAGGAGNDKIYGRGGNDIIIGGTGNDTLSGDGGNDTYIYDLGDGNDIVNEFSSNGGWGGNDTIQFGAGILTSEVSVVQANNGRDLVLTFVDGGSITIKDTMVSSDHRVETVAFADGTIWNHAALVDRSMAANGGNDVLYGSYDGETIVGGIGNDTIFGRAGNDIIIGGTGNDTLSGDGGNDTYIYDLGDGNDIVNEFSGNGGWGGNDSIQFGAGILASEVTVTQANNGRDLVLTFVDGGSVTIKDTMVSSDYRVETVAFADGTIWNHAALVDRSMAANGGNDVLYGSYDSETIVGGAGNDKIYGRGGNDVIIGGTGNDTLSGDGGNDTYIYDLGDGNDIVNEFSSNGGWGGNDSIQFGAGILASEVTVTQANNGRDLVLTFVDGGSVTIKDTMVSSDYRVETVAFADGTIWNHATLTTMSMAANSGNIYFSGDSKNTGSSPSRQQVASFSLRDLDESDRSGPHGHKHNQLEAVGRYERDPIAHWPQFADQKIWSGPAAIALDGLEQFHSSQTITTSTASPVSNIGRQVALMVQEMNVFGVQSAGDSAQAWQHENVRPMDFFA